VFAKDVHLALSVALKNVRGADQVKFLFRAFAAAEVAARGLKRKRVARYPCVVADQHHVDGAKFSIRVSGPKYSRERRIAPSLPGSDLPMAIWKTVLSGA
jgi:hypothetical protein